MFLQQTNSSGTMHTKVNKGPTSSVTVPSLVSNKTLRDLNAKIEELQQESVRVKSQTISRDSYMKKCFRDQEREINTPKRKGCGTCQATGSAPRLARRTDKVKSCHPACRVSCHSISATTYQAHSRGGDGG